MLKYCNILKANKTIGGIILKKYIKGISVLLTAAAFFPVCTFANNNNSTQAASLASVNSDVMFLKQHTSYTCTLSANAMLMRRSVMLKGGDWSSVDEDSCRSSFWIEGVGMPFTYTYRGIHVDNERIYGSSASILKELLSEHPEGIVAYDYDIPHAVLLTDYTDGKFYCADPARNTPSGRIEVSQSLIDVNDIEDYWYVTDDLPRPGKSNVKNESTINTLKTIVGKTITINGAAKGGDGDLTYNYYYKTSKDADWNKMNDSNTKTVQLKPEKAGTYYFRVDIQDNYNTMSKKYFTVNVNTALELSVKQDKTDVKFGEDIKLTFDSKNGLGGYKYDISAEKPSGQTVKLRNNYSQNEYVYHPWETGEYKIKAVLKDAGGNTVAKEISFKVSTDELVNASTAEKSVINYGEDIVFKNSASGGVGGYKYKYIAVKPSGKAVVLRNYSASASYTYHPWEQGKYTVNITAMDNEGNVNTKLVVFTVAVAPIENKITSDNKEISYGSNISFKSSATGGYGSYEYEYYATKPSGQKVKLRKFLNSPNYTYYPWEKGTYIIESQAKDSKGNIAVTEYSFLVK